MTNCGAAAGHAVLATEPPAGVALGRAGTSLEERGPASARPGHAPDGRRGPRWRGRGPTLDFGPAFRVRQSARVCLVPGENSGAAAPSSANDSAPVAGSAPKPNLTDAADRQPSRLKAFRNTLTEPPLSRSQKGIPDKAAEASRTARPRASPRLGRFRKKSGPMVRTLARRWTPSASPCGFLRPRTRAGGDAAADCTGRRHPPDGRGRRVAAAQARLPSEGIVEHGPAVAMTCPSRASSP